MDYGSGWPSNANARCDARAVETVGATVWGAEEGGV